MAENGIMEANNDPIGLGMPEKSAKDKWLFSQVFRESKEHALLLDPNVDLEIIRRSVFHRLHTLPDKDFREKISKRFDELMGKIPEDMANRDQKEWMYYHALLPIIGEISDFYDKHVGVTHENKIGIGGVPFWLLPEYTQEQEEEDAKRCLGIS